MPRDLYFVLVVGTLLAIATFFPAVTLRLRSLYGVILPELALFDNYRERRSALQISLRGVHSVAWSTLLMVGIGAGLSILITRVPWGRSASFSLFLPAVFFSTCPTAGAVFWCLFRERVRHSLRQQLVERGHAICLQCGYDLRGQSEPRCPECGQAMTPAARGADTAVRAAGRG